MKKEKKLYNELKKQLKGGYKSDAEKCLKIYDALIENIGAVWQSDWSVLVRCTYFGVYPNCIPVYKPTRIGELFLIGVEGKI